MARTQQKTRIFARPSSPRTPYHHVNNHVEIPGQRTVLHCVRSHEYSRLTRFRDVDGGMQVRRSTRYRFTFLSTTINTRNLILRFGLFDPDHTIQDTLLYILIYTCRISTSSLTMATGYLDAGQTPPEENKLQEK